MAIDASNGNVQPAINRKRIKTCGRRVIILPNAAGILTNRSNDANFKAVAEREIAPEEIGDDKPVEFYEAEEAKRCFEAGLEAALREKSQKSLSESIGDALDHGRQDENHRA